MRTNCSAALGLFFGVLLCSCRPTSSPAVPQINDFVLIADIDPDPQTIFVVHATLESNGIPSFIHGSVVYGVSVLPKDTGRAKKILRELAEKRGYRVTFD